MGYLLEGLLLEIIDLRLKVGQLNLDQVLELCVLLSIVGITKY